MGKNHKKDQLKALVSAWRDPQSNKPTVESVSNWVCEGVFGHYSPYFMNPVTDDDAAPQFFNSAYDFPVGNALISVGASLKDGSFSDDPSGDADSLDLDDLSVTFGAALPFSLIKMAKDLPSYVGFYSDHQEDPHRYAERLKSWNKAMVEVLYAARVLDVKGIGSFVQTAWDCFNKAPYALVQDTRAVRPWDLEREFLLCAVTAGAKGEGAYLRGFMRDMTDRVGYDPVIGFNPAVPLKVIVPFLECKRIIGMGL